jgi:ABC-type dipeptide/oligopeptide/nickel transport system ATPase component
MSINRQTRPILSLRNLRIEAPSAKGPLSLVHGINLDIAPGERLALVGESGSGKSVTSRAILQLNRGLRTHGSIMLCGQEIVGLSSRAMRRVRGSMASMVFQDPMAALNPVRTIGAQVMEPLRIRGVPPRTARMRAIELLERLGVRDAEARMGCYPHEFSGGMRQRVVLAAALICQPSLLIADEPTTALDVRVQEQVLDVIDDYARDMQMSVLLITHDLGIVAGFAERVAVLYRGNLIEDRPVDDLFADPQQDYTRALLAALPRIDAPIDRQLNTTASCTLGEGTTR